MLNSRGNFGELYFVFIHMITFIFMEYIRNTLMWKIDACVNISFTVQLQFITVFICFQIREGVS